VHGRGGHCLCVGPLPPLSPASRSARMVALITDQTASGRRGRDGQAACEAERRSSARWLPMVGFHQIELPTSEGRPQPTHWPPVRVDLPDGEPAARVKSSQAKPSQVQVELGPRGRPAITALPPLTDAAVPTAAVQRQAAPQTVDIVVAMHSTPIYSLLHALLAAMPLATVQVHVHVYHKGLALSDADRASIERAVSQAAARTALPSTALHSTELLHSTANLHTDLRRRRVRRRRHPQQGHGQQPPQPPPPLPPPPQHSLPQQRLQQQRREEEAPPEQQEHVAAYTPKLTITEGLPNSGRCDHTYMLHITRRWATLADVTLFVKDTAMAHVHLGVGGRLLSFARRLPASPTFHFWCGRPIWRAACWYEATGYLSEACRSPLQAVMRGEAHMHTHCYANETAAPFIQSPVRPLASWLAHHKIGDEPDRWRQCSRPSVDRHARVGARAGAAAGSAYGRGRRLSTAAPRGRLWGGARRAERASPRGSRQERGLEEVPFCVGGVFAASRVAIRSSSVGLYRRLLARLSVGDNLEEGHYAERAYLLLMGVRSWRHMRTSLAVYTVVDTSADQGGDAAHLAPASAPCNRSAISPRSRIALHCLCFSDSAAVLALARARGWHTSLIVPLATSPASLPPASRARSQVKPSQAEPSLLACLPPLARVITSQVKSSQAKSSIARVMT